MHLALINIAKSKHPIDDPCMAVWWIEEGEIPSIKEGKRRLDLINKNGVTYDAFTFGSPFYTNGNPRNAD